MMAEKTIDELLEELGYGDVAAISPVKTPSKEKTKKKVKDLIIEGAKQGRAGLNRGAARQLKLLEEENY